MPDTIAQSPEKISRPKDDLEGRVRSLEQWRAGLVAATAILAAGGIYGAKEYLQFASEVARARGQVEQAKDVALREVGETAGTAVSAAAGAELDRRFDDVRGRIAALQETVDTNTRADWNVVNRRLGEMRYAREDPQNWPLRGIVPDRAREILVFARVQIGNSRGDDGVTYRISVRKDGRDIGMHLAAQANFNDGAIVVNSDNMWLPYPREDGLLTAVMASGPPVIAGSRSSEVWILGWR